MANPLAGSAGGGGSDSLKPGEKRTILAKDKQGNIVKTMTLHRTEREYVYDLCDCYNAHRTAEAKERGVEWYVAPNGELKIGDSAAWSRHTAKQTESRNETERARFNRMQLEAARRQNAYQPEDA
jgi:hypothetical protein